MQISSVSPVALDASTADELAALHNRAQAVDAPHQPDDTGEILRLRLVHRWDGEGAERVLLARDGTGRMLGFVEVDLPKQDNLNLVLFTIVVDPPLRRGGIGTALLDAVYDVAREVGRGLLISSAWHGTAGVTFLQRHGFEQASIAAQRRLHPHRLPRDGDAQLLAQARQASPDYALVRITGPLPEHLVEPMVATVQSINDAPLDDLEYEDENYTADRLRRYDQAQLVQQQRIYRILALDRSDTPVAHTVVAVDGRRPWHGEQHDTTVRREHRGHRLGLRLKLEMLEWLRAAEPQLEVVDTWNQESNGHMIAVNDAIGCTVVGRELQFQKHV